MCLCLYRQLNGLLAVVVAVAVAVVVVVVVVLKFILSVITLTDKTRVSLENCFVDC